MQQAIVGFHQDDVGDWVADLACGHTQHMRHQPPWMNRPWVMTAAGRHQAIGRLLVCKQCEPHHRDQPADLVTMQAEKGSRDVG
jgi:hypothetical protein